ncbi:hypothetical protein MesoLj131a_57760 [Mesorhizobium sp. 131-2-1]|nr:hypothetical protein MesoLj131a_57760 [Mesorhizobium sp. 131-2-1]
MDTIFDDLPAALSQTPGDAWSPVRALDFAGKLVIGVAIGLEIAVGLALAG